MAKSKHQVRFPGESESYRAERDKLLDAEIEMRRTIESVAAQRRRLPLGGEAPQDYAFEEIVGADAKGKKRKVRMSELFAPGKDSLILYSFMFGPEMPSACPSCTSIIDGLDGEAPHVMQRVNFASSQSRRSSAYAIGRKSGVGAICDSCRPRDRRTTTTTRGRTRKASRCQP